MATVAAGLLLMSVGVARADNLQENDLAGDYVITANVADNGPGTYNKTPATFTLRVTAPVVEEPEDTTPPVITAPDNTKEATGPTTSVSFNATAVDAVDGPRP